MTAATTQLCGHRWFRRARCDHGGRGGAHGCILPADHHDDEPATSCRCRCGATTTRERTDP